MRASAPQQAQLFRAPLSREGEELSLKPEALRIFFPPALLRRIVITHVTRPFRFYLAEKLPPTQRLAQVTRTQL